MTECPHCGLEPNHMTDCPHCGVRLTADCPLCGLDAAPSVALLELPPAFVAACVLNGRRPKAVAAAILGELFDPQDHLRPYYQRLFDAAILEAE